MRGKNTSDVSKLAQKGKEELVPSMGREGTSNVSFTKEFSGVEDGSPDRTCSVIVSISSENPNSVTFRFSLKGNGESVAQVDFKGYSTPLVESFKPSLPTTEGIFYSPSGTIQKPYKLTPKIWWDRSVNVFSVYLERMVGGVGMIYGDYPETFHIRFDNEKQKITHFKYTNSDPLRRGRNTEPFAAGCNLK